MKLSIFLLAGLFAIVQPAPLSNGKDVEKIDGFITQLDHVGSMLKDTLQDLEERRNKVQNKETEVNKDTPKKDEDSIDNWIPVEKEENIDENEGSDTMSYEDGENPQGQKEETDEDRNGEQTTEYGTYKTADTEDDITQWVPAIDENKGSDTMSDEDEGGQKEETDEDRNGGETTEYGTYKTADKRSAENDEESHERQEEETDQNRGYNEQKADTNPATKDLREQLEEEFHDVADQKMLDNMENELSKLPN